MTTVLGVLAALLTLGSAFGLVRSHYRWQTAALAYAALVLAAALARSVLPVPQLLVFLLMTFAFARLVIPSFPTGPVHVMLAAVAIAAVAWCAAALPERVDSSSFHTTFVVVGWAVVATAAASALAMVLPLHGTAQRPRLREGLFDVATIVWFLVVSVHFL